MKYTARDMANCLDNILHGKVTTMRCGDFTIAQRLAAGGIHISNAVAQKLVDAFKVQPKTDEEMELWKTLLDRNEALSAELVQARSDLATYNHYTEVTENRIIDAEFAQHEAETKLAQAGAAGRDLVANGMRVIGERDTARRLLDATRVERNDARNVNAVLNSDRLTVCATLRTVEGERDAAKLQYKVESDACNAALRQRDVARAERDAHVSEGIAWMKNYGMKTESLIRERVKLIKECDAAQGTAADMRKERDAFHKASDIHLALSVRMVEERDRLLKVAHAAAKSIALDTTARWLTLNNACNDVKDILDRNDAPKFDVNSEPFLKPHVPKAQRTPRRE